MFEIFNILLFSNAKLIQLIPGIILFEPLLFIVKRKVEAIRQIELKKSEFRLKGYDVVGTSMCLEMGKILPKAIILLLVTIYIVCPLTFVEYVVFSCMSIVAIFLYSIYYVKIWDFMMMEMQKLLSYLNYMIWNQSYNHEVVEKAELRSMIEKFVFDNPSLFVTLK